MFHLSFRSNVLGTKFTVYDGGENPEKKPFIKECELLRQELAAICYVSTSLLHPASSKNIVYQEICNGVLLCAAGHKRAGVQGSQENDGDHPRHVRER